MTIKHYSTTHAGAGFQLVPFFIILVCNEDVRQVCLQQTLDLIYQLAVGKKQWRIAIRHNNAITKS